MAIRITRLVRALPELATERILAAYAASNGYPEVAARRLGVTRNTLHRYNRQLGIIGLVRRRTGHYPGWLGSGAWNFAPAWTP